MGRPKKEVVETTTEAVQEALKLESISDEEILIARKIFGSEFRDLLNCEPEDRDILIREAISDARKAKIQREKQRNIFATLSAIDVTPYVKVMNEGGKDLQYLPWAAADKLVKQVYPLMEKRVVMFPDKEGVMHPYRYDRITGNFTVHTEITIEGLTIGEDLVVMENNIPVRAHSYTVLTRWGEYTIPPINDNMINKTKRRCFVKNLAQFGLGIDMFFTDTVESAEDNDVTNVPDPVVVPEQYTNMEEKKHENAEKESVKVKEPENTPSAVVSEPDAESSEEPAAEKHEDHVEMTVESALEHVFANGGESLKGHKVSDLVFGTKDTKKSTNILRSFANCGVGDDKLATKIVLDAIERGDLKFVLASA